MPQVKIEAGEEPVIVNFPDSMDYEEIRQVLNRKFEPVKQFMQHVWSNMSVLDRAAVGTMFVPVVGDVAGLAADIDMFVKDPESRTVINGLFAAAGVLPLVPAASQARRLADMSAEARLALAQESGHMTSMPLYHGTAAADPLDPAGEITAFSVGGKGQRNFQGKAAQQGVYAAVDPEMASEFAELSAAQRGGEGARVLKLTHRAETPGRIDLTGSETDDEIAATLANAWDEGYDSIMMTNYTTPAGKTGNIVVVKDPAQLRSVNADYDPAKKHSADILAGIGGGAVLTGAAASRREDEEI